MAGRFDLEGYEVVSVLRRGTLRLRRTADGASFLGRSVARLPGDAAAMDRLFEQDRPVLAFVQDGFLRLREAVRTDGRYNFVFDDAGGQTSWDRIQDQGPVSETAGIAWASQIVEACEHSVRRLGRAAGVLEPERVWITRESDIRLEPPLLTPRRAAAHDDSGGDFAALGRWLAFAVTGEWLAPEILRDPEAHARCGLGARSPALRGLVQNLACSTAGAGHTTWHQVWVDLDHARKGDVPAPVGPPPARNAPRPAAEPARVRRPPLPIPGWLRVGAIAAVLTAGLILILPRALRQEDATALPESSTSEPSAPATPLPAAGTPTEPAPDAASSALSPAAHPPGSSAETAGAGEDFAALKDYAGLMAAVFARGDSREFEAAAGELASWADAHPSHPYAAAAREDVERLRRLAGMPARLESRSAAVRGAIVRTADGVEEPVESVGGGFVGLRRRVEQGTVRFDLPLRDLEAGEYLKLVARALPDEATSAAAGLHIASARFVEARRVILEAEQRGEEIRALGEWEADWRQAWTEGQALRAAERIGAMLDRGDAEAARAAFARASELFRTSAAFAHLAPDLQARLDRAPAARAVAATPAATAAPEDRPRSSLPPLTGSTVMLPATRDLVARATAAAVTQDLWAAYLADIRQALADATIPKAVFLREQSFRQMLAHPVVARLAAQAAFLRLLSPARLQRFAAEDGARDLVAWILGDTAVIQGFLRTVEPADDLDQAMRVWLRLWSYNREAVKQHPSLATAFALVYDQPPNKREASDLFQFFVDSAKARQLKTDIDLTPPWELVWVVDVGLPVEELRWAQTHVALGRGSWGKAYGMVPYRMDKAVNGINPYPNGYTLEAIKDEGGVCADQAYFAANTAKANGIPAMIIAGTGQRGGHAWIGYKESTTKWNLEAGRYGGDEYAAGATRNPQTGAAMKEHELRLMADPQTRSASAFSADLLLWLGQALLDGGHPDEGGAALELALRDSNRHRRAWEAYLEYLRGARRDDALYARAIRDLRTAFRDFPDMLALANQLELERALAAEGAAGAAELARRQTRRILDRSAERTDLYLAAVWKETDLLLRAGDTNGALKRCEDALEKKGSEAPAYLEIGRRYFDLARAAGHGHDAARDLESAYERYHRREGDYFRETMRVQLMNLLADCLAADGQTWKADRLRRDAEKALAEAKEPWDKKKYKKSYDTVPKYDDGGGT